MWHSTPPPIWHSTVISWSAHAVWYNGDRIGQGKDNVREFLKENPAIAQDIEAKIRAKLGVKAGSAVVSDVLSAEEEVE